MNPPEITMTEIVTANIDFYSKEQDLFWKKKSYFPFFHNIEGQGFDHVDVCKTKPMNTACRQKIWTSQKRGQRSRFYKPRKVHWIGKS